MPEKNYRPVNPNADIFCALLEGLWAMAMVGMVLSQIVFWTLVVGGIAGVAALAYWVWNHLSIAIVYDVTFSFVKH